MHYLNPRERAALREVARGAILRAAIAGALSGAVSAIAEILARPLLGPEPDLAGWREQMIVWSIVGGATAVASVIEIAFLYWDGLRSVHRLAQVAGLDLFPGGERGEHTAIAGAMARAALELPNPTRELFGIDPMRDASRFGVMVASIVYKAKISATSFFLKVIVRRAFGRALVRTYVPLVAVPVTAAWNAIVAWLVLREARVRAMGPSAAHEMVEAVLGDASSLSEEGGAAAKRAVAAAIVRTRDLHPNLVALWLEVSRRVQHVTRSALDPVDDARYFLGTLQKLGDAERRVVLRILGVATVLDGRVTPAERRLIRSAYAACDLPSGEARIEALHRAFMRGDRVPQEQLDALV